MKTLIITTPNKNNINPNLLPLINAASKICNHCEVLVVGSNVEVTANAIASFAKVNTVYKLESSNLNNLLVENIAPQLAGIVKNYTHVLCASDSFGKNLLPRIAGILEIGQISEVTDIVSPNIFKKFMYAGNVLVEIESLEDIKLLTIRTSNFSGHCQVSSQETNTVKIDYIDNLHPGIKWKTENTIDKSVDLGSAKIVVSGGRSLGSKEQFDQCIRSLASKLNAAVGATRAAVEAGFAPNDSQVGQTGKVVAPQVYLAIGVSGAVQHIAGMKDSKIVIAINTDHTAPIFEYADYGIVGDLFEIIPQLLNQLEEK